MIPPADIRLRSIFLYINIEVLLLFHQSPAEYDDSIFI